MILPQQDQLLPSLDFCDTVYTPQLFVILSVKCPGSFKLETMQCHLYVSLPSPMPGTEEALRKCAQSKFVHVELSFKIFEDLYKLCLYEKELELVWK